MASWEELTMAAPELAATARARFGAHKHALIATLRADGSPRLSGIETDFSRGELWLGMMPSSRKSADLLEASVVTVDGDHLVIDSWRVGEAPTRRTRT